MVDIHITGVHCRVSDKAKSYITEKLGALKRFHSSLRSLHVSIHEAEKHGYRVDVNMHLPTGEDVVAHELGDSLFSAVDVVSAKCAAQLRRIHGRHMEPQRMRA